MALLRFLSRDAKLLEVFQAFPEFWRPVIEYHETVMRGASAFTVAERELIAAYVSARNQCGYCHGVHAATAERFGVATEVFEQLQRDLVSAEIDERMKPVLRYVGKLTDAPSTIREDDVVAMREQGWDDAAIHHAALVCALFNFMNRMVEGLGISADDAYFAESSARLHAGGYAGLLGLLSAKGTDEA